MAEINLKKVLQDSYDLLIDGIIKDAHLKKTKEGKYEIESRTKLKSLVEAIRQHDKPEDSVLHFIKYAEYFLPRSKFYETLGVLLEKIKDTKERNENKETIKIEIQYVIGYALWAVDALCNIFKESKNNEEVRRHVKMMLDTEFEIAEMKDEDKKSKIVDAIFEWYNEANK